MNVMMMSPTSRRYQDLIIELGQMEYDRTHLYINGYPRSREMEEMIVEAVSYKALAEAEEEIRDYKHPSFSYEYLFENDATDETNLISQVASYAIEKDELKKQRMGKQILEGLVSNMLSYGKHSVERDLEEKAEDIAVYEQHEAPQYYQSGQ